MHEFHHVLFPVDFSVRCANTVPYVKEMVRSCNASLTLLHVVEIPLSWYATMQPEAPIAWSTFEDIEGMARERMNAFGCEHFSDLARETAVEADCDRGDPGYAIVAHAEEKGADLIMMPSHGHGPFRTFVLGSATARVLHRASCPVWTGAHLENPLTVAHGHIKNIVCGIDLEKESCHVIEAAVMLARKFSAQVRLVHCIPVPERGPVEDFVSEFDLFLADSATDRITRIQEQAGTDFEVCLQGGRIANVMREAALRQSADLMVIGRGHANAPLSRLRSNAYSIIQNSPCPVLSV